MENNENLDNFSISLEKLFRLLLYSYGGPNSHTYDAGVCMIVAQVISYRLKGKVERPDLFLYIRDWLKMHWKHNKHPERWNGTSFDEYKPDL